MTEEGRSSRDSDWYVSRLYAFAEAMGCSLLIPRYSRYVVDLNRSPDGASLYPGSDVTGLVPTDSFRKRPLYLPGQEPSPDECEERVRTYWASYHQALQEELARLAEQGKPVILFEAHSIASRVPRFFDGTLPDFNFGTNEGRSCDPELQDLLQTFDTRPFSRVLDGRFKGGFITRHYGRPDDGVHAVQLELSQATYMDEGTMSWDEARARSVIPVLERLLRSLSSWRNKKAAA